MIDKEQEFSKLMQDATDIADELGDLEKFLKIDAKTKTINEYQVFETLYLKHKIESCLEKIALFEEENNGTYTRELAQTSKVQFEQFKKIIDVLDLTNRSREISSSYTEEEAAFIKAWEDKREKRNPESEKYPIRTRITGDLFQASNTIRKNHKKRTYEDRMLVPLLVILIVVFMIYKNYIVSCIYAFMCICIAIKGIIHYKKRSVEINGHVSDQAMITCKTGLKKNLVIKHLWPAAKQLKMEISRYQQKVNLTENYNLPKADHEFGKYEDYECYVLLYLISEQINPLLLEKGITLEKEPKKKYIKGYLDYIKNFNKAPKKTVLVRQENGTKKKPKIMKDDAVKPVMKRPIKNSNYTSTKGIRQTNYIRRGR